MKRLIQKLALALLLLAGPMGCKRTDSTGRATASAGLLELELSTNRVLIGAAFTLEATVRSNAGQRVEFDPPGAPPALVLRNSRALRSSGSDWRRTWELVALRPGVHTVWTGAIRRIDAEGNVTEVAIPALSIEVVSSRQPEDLALKELAGLQQWPRRIWERVLIMVALVGALAALLAWAVRRLRSRRRIDIPPPAIPPHEVARAALMALRREGVPNTPAAVEAYFVNLSGIVRRYLEDAFDLRAPEQTTEEFIRSASCSRQLTLEHQQLVAAFLEQSDLVKFARFIPEAADITAALDAAIRLVEETKPPPSQLPANAALRAP